MTKLERYMMEYINKHLFAFFIITVTLLGIMFRYVGRNIVSVDASTFLLPWFEEIDREGGIYALAKQVGNYSIPYQILIAFMTYIPLPPLYLYKSLSILFDFLLSVACGWLVFLCADTEKKLKAAVAYAVTFCSATVVLNSSAWAQCDSIYSMFVLLSLCFFIKERWRLSFAVFGCAFAFKLQAVFIIPFYAVYYFSTKRFSICHALIVPVVNILLILPAVIMGRPISQSLQIYGDQITAYESKLYLNYPSFYALLISNDNPDIVNYFSALGILITVCILGIALFVILYSKIDLFKSRMWLPSALWAVWTCVLFLPHMHERYGYIGDVLSIALACTRPKAAWMAVIYNLISLCSYGGFLFGYQAFDMKSLAIINVSLYVVFCYFCKHEAQR